MNSTIASLGRTLNSDADWSFHRNLFGFLKLLHCIGICGFRLVSFTDTPEVSQGFSMRLSENILGHCIFCLSVQISTGRSAFVEEKNKDYGKLSFWNILLFAFFSYAHVCYSSPPPHVSIQQHPRSFVLLVLDLSFWSVLLFSWPLLSLSTPEIGSSKHMGVCLIIAGSGHVNNFVHCFHPRTLAKNM